MDVAITASCAFTLMLKKKRWGLFEECGGGVERGGLFLDVF